MRKQRRRKKAILTRWGRWTLLGLLLIAGVSGGNALLSTHQHAAAPAKQVQQQSAPVKPKQPPTATTPAQQTKTSVPSAVPKQETEKPNPIYSKTIEVNQVQTQHGIRVKVEQVVFLQEMMSVVVEVENNSSTEAAFHIHDTEVTQGGQTYLWVVSSQPLLPQTTAPWKTTQGVLTFHGVSPKQPFTLSIDVKVDSTASMFAPYLFEIKPV